MLPGHDDKLSLKAKSWTINNSVLLSCVILLAAGLRFYQLDFQSLWYDELHSMNGASPDKTFAEVIDYARTDQPPAYFLLLNTWFKIFPYNDFYGRLFSAVAGVAGVIVAYFLGKEFRDAKLGLITSLVVSLNYFHVYFSYEVRFYSILFVFSALSFLLMMRANRSRSNVDFILYSLATAACIYTHYYGLVLFLSQGLIFIALLIHKKRDNVYIYKAAGAAVLTTILVLPWMPQYLSDSSLTFWVEPVRFPRFIAAYFYNYFRDFGLVAFIGIVLVIALISLVKTGELKKNFDDNFLIVLGWITLSFLIPYFYSVLIAPMLVIRYTMIAVPGILLILAFAFYSLKPAYRGWAVLLMTLLSLRALIVVQDFYTKPLKEQWREVASLAISRQQERSLHLSYYAWHYNYYFRVLGSDIRVKHPTSIDFNESLKMVDRVWVLQGHEDNIGLSNEELAMIKREFDLADERIFIGARATVFERKK